MALGGGFSSKRSDSAFSTASENYSHTYAALTSQALGAEQVAVAISGIGVYRDYSGSRLDTMNDMYLRALPTLSADWWDFSRWVPDAVIINLGTNDFATGDPGRAAFTTAYQSLIAQVRAKSPSALIVVGLGPMLSSGALTQARSYLTGLVADLNAASDTRVKLLEFPNQDSSGSYGCDYHPSAATHQQMADQLATFLRAQLGW